MSKSKVITHKNSFTLIFFQITYNWFRPLRQKKVVLIMNMQMIYIYIFI
jgi:hypothetical protein